VFAKIQKDLAAGSYAAALEGLVGAWGRCKAAELADLIEQLGAWLAAKLPPIEGNQRTIDTAFRDVADQRQLVDVPRLIAAFELGGSGRIAGWLEILDLFPADPRLCAPALALTVRILNSSAKTAQTRAFRMAEKIADGRCIPQLEKLIATKHAEWTWEHTKARLTKLRANLAPPPPIPAADKPAVAALAKAIPKLVKKPPPKNAAGSATPTTSGKTGDQLLAQILSNPDDDDARLVYSDYLQQAGTDPRGELIALQKPEPTAAQRERIRKLVRTG
jgi:uncharacterized protein (TIGR02996 family)